MKILVLGDVGTGKSSLISSFISRHFPEEPPDVMTDAVLPARASANRTPTTLMDSSSRPGLDRDVLKRKISMADSIIALYDATRLDTLESLTAEWMPLVVEQLGHERAQVVVVASKVDLLGEDMLQDDDARHGRVQEENEKLVGLQLAFPCIKSVCRCSAKLLNVDEVFYTAETIVIYPIHTLYDPEMGDFTPSCRRALLRVFRILDEDRDNLLSDKEVQSLQEKCFGDNLDEEDLEALKKEAVARTGKEALGPGRQRYLSFTGFCAFLKIFIERAQPQQLWIILRRFGYNATSDLDLQDVPDFAPVNCAPSSSPIGGAFNVVSELSPAAVRFLVDVATCESRSTLHKTTPEEKEKAKLEASTDNESLLRRENELRQWGEVVTRCKTQPLSWQQIMTVYSVLAPDDTHAWDENNEMSLVSDGASHFILCGLRPGSSGPSANAQPPLEVWLSHWYLLAALRPDMVQTLLSMLGYVERPGPDLGVTLQSTLFHQRGSKEGRCRRTLHVLLLGHDEQDKRESVNAMLTHFAGLSADEGMSARGADTGLPLSTSFFLPGHEVTRLESGPWREDSDTGGKPSFRDDLAAHPSTAVDGEGVERGAFVIVTSVPQSEEVAWMARFGGSVDVILQMFGDKEGLNDCQGHQESLPTAVPRALVSNYVDLDLQEDTEHWLAQQDMLPLLPISKDSENQVAAALVALALRAAGNPSKALPSKLRRSRWAGLARSVGGTVALVTVLSVGTYYAAEYFAPGSINTLKKEARRGLKSVMVTCWDMMPAFVLNGGAMAMGVAKGGDMGGEAAVLIAD